MGKRGGQHPALPRSENISGTLAEIPEHVSVNCACTEGPEPAADRCGYVIANPSGRPPRFCDAPTARGSSYCLRHRALCQVPPGSEAAARIAAELTCEGAALLPA